MYSFRLCQHRWVEGIKVAEQALKIWPHVNKYAKTVKSERTAPASVSFVSVISACNNTLIEAKLEFFVAVPKLLKEFLLKFQTEAPMTPFLALFLKDLLLAMMDLYLILLWYHGVNITPGFFDRLNILNFEITSFHLALYFLCRFLSTVFIHSILISVLPFL